MTAKKTRLSVLGVAILMSYSQLAFGMFPCGPKKQNRPPITDIMDLDSISLAENKIAEYGDKKFLVFDGNEVGDLSYLLYLLM